MAFLKTSPGDYVAIPAHDAGNACGFVLARHIDLLGGTPLFEVYERLYNASPVNIAAIDVSTRLFRPVMMLLEFGRGSVPTQHKWRVLFNDQTYHRAQSGYAAIKIGFPSSSRHTQAGVVYPLWCGGEDRLVSKSEVMREEASDWWTPLRISMRVSAHLAGIISPDEPFADWKLTQLDNTPENAQAILTSFEQKLVQALQDSSTIAARFKEWDKTKKLAQEKLPPSRR